MIVDIYIFEDDVFFRENIKDFIEQRVINNYSVIEFRVKEIERISEFYEQLNYLQIKDTDFFLIDIELRTFFSGIDIGKKIREKNDKCKIIYLTNLDNKASEIINKGIRADAYLLKTDNQKVISFKLKDMFEELTNSLYNQLENIDKQIVFKEQNKVVIINFTDILYLNVAKGLRNALFVKCKDRELIVSGTLKKVKKEFPDPPFYLDLKAYIINLSLIQELNRSVGIIEFKGGHELFLSSEIISKILKKRMMLSR